MRYEAEVEILEVIELFEAVLLSHDRWRHAEHLIIAMHYSRLYDLEKALNSMRNGILKLNAFHEVTTTADRGYHETLTVFWTRTVFDYVRANQNKSLLAMANEIIERFDKDYPLKFYSRERLFSIEARYGLVEPDLTPENLKQKIKLFNSF